MDGETMQPMGGNMLDGKVAIVTGGSRGIGEAIAKAFAAAGARVVVAGRKLEPLQAVVQQIEATGGEALAVPTHMGQPEAVHELARQTVAAYGTIDIAVNNAATNPHFGPLLEAGDSQWLKTLEVNLLGYLRLIQAVTPVMQARRSGRIINVASTAGLRAFPGLGVYGVSKAAVIQVTRQLAMELGPDNIQVNAIAPGVIETQFSAILWQGGPVTQHLKDLVPLGRFGRAEEVAAAALYLASPLAAYTSGTVLVVDGGTSA